MWCIDWTLKEVAWIYNFKPTLFFLLFGIPCCTLDSLIPWPYTLPVLPHEISCFSYYNWTNISPPFVIPCIKTISSTKLSVMSSCHQFIFLNQEKKNTSPLLLPKLSYRIINQVIRFPPKHFSQHS